MTDLYHVLDNRKFLIHVSYPLLDFSVIVYLMNVIVQVVVEERVMESSSMFLNFVAIS